MGRNEAKDTLDSIGSGHAEKYADLMLDWTFKRVFGEIGGIGRVNFLQGYQSVLA